MTGRRRTVLARLAIAGALAASGCSRESAPRASGLLRLADDAAIETIESPDLALRRGEAPVAQGAPWLALDGRSGWRYFRCSDELARGAVGPLGSFSPDHARRVLDLPELYLPAGFGCAYFVDLDAAGPLWLEAAGSFGDGSALGASCVAMTDRTPEMLPRLVPGELRDRIERAAIGGARPCAIAGERATLAFEPPPQARSLVLLVTNSGDRIERVDSVALHRLTDFGALVATGALSPRGVAVVEHGGIARPSLVLTAGTRLVTRPVTLREVSTLRLATAAIGEGAGGLALHLAWLGPDSKPIATAEREGPPNPYDWQPLEWTASEARGEVRLELRCDLRDGAARMPGAQPMLCVGTPRIAARERDRRPDVVLISIDSLRRDHLGCGGDARGLTPAMDFLAQRSLRFTHARAHAPATLPAHVSLFSGLLPEAHGVESSDDRIPPGCPLVADELARAGYATAAFTSGGFVSVDHGFQRGFDQFCEVDPIGERWYGGIGWNGKRIGTGAAGSLQRALAFLDADEGAPRFLLLHTSLAQGYLPPAPLARRFGLLAEGAPPLDAEAVRRFEPEQVLAHGLDEADRARMKNAYAAAVAATDQLVGDVMRFLMDRDRLESTIVIVTSDHGQELFDHGGTGHGVTLYDEMLRVPLLMHFPAVAPAVIDEPVGHVDVLPTLLDALRLPPPAVTQGLAVVGHADRLRGRAQIAEVRDPRRPSRTAIVLGDRKLILTGDSAEAFDLAADPREADALRDPQDLAALRAALDAASQQSEAIRGKLDR